MVIRRAPQGFRFLVVEADKSGVAAIPTKTREDADSIADQIRVAQGKHSPP